MTNKPTSKVIQISSTRFRDGVIVHYHLCEDGSTWELYGHEWECVVEAYQEPETKKEQKLPEVGNCYAEKGDNRRTITIEKVTKDIEGGRVHPKGSSSISLNGFWDDWEELPDQETKE